MTPERCVSQTTFHNPDIPTSGNCTQAAVATILNKALEDVPAFQNHLYDPVVFWQQFRRFLKACGFYVLRLDGSYVPDALYLASGPSERGISHMVVMQSGELVHDPHPSKTGLRMVECVWLLLPIDPATVQVVP